MTNMNRTTNKQTAVQTAGFLVGVALLLAAVSVAGKPAAKPKLVVLLVVDQMRADYVDRFGPSWHGGLRRLMDQGARFTNAAYPYANTVTCAGHSTIGTGDFPSTHGMIANEWLDRDTRHLVACASDPHAKLIPYRGGGHAAEPGESDWRMQVPTFAEQVREKSPGSRVVTMSLKARSAATLAGHHADAVTWIEGSDWATSTAYGTGPVPEVAAYVTAHPLEAELGKTWTAPAAIDDAGSKTDSGGPLTSAFPHAMSASASGQGSFYRVWGGSPFSDEYLGAMAEALVDSFGLGNRSGIDVLGISFSALDIVGHQFGPQSLEVRDILAHLDETLGKLFDHLDRTVGRDNYVVALSADHGVARIPEAAKSVGSDAGRVDALALKTAVEKSLAPYSLGENPVEDLDDSDLYFANGVFDKLKANPAEMRSVIDAIRGIEGVGYVFRSDELKKEASKNPIAKAVSLSYFAGRSGDLIVIPKANWFFDNKSGGNWSIGTTHGTPYEYDQRVPLFVMGVGIRAKSHSERVSPADIAPTLAKACGIDLAPTDGKPLPIR
jgi:predicted AlkP superfamily pyrophosphatase or phosphodiesterase